MHCFDVVAVEIADEPAVVAGVVLGPDTGFVEHVDTFGSRRLDKCVHLLPRLRRKQMWMSLWGAPASPTGPSQKHGKSTPMPATSPKVMMVLPPIGARTFS